MELGNKEKAVEILSRFIRTGQRNTRIIEMLEKLKEE
jgi:hypothetical protein